MRHYIRTFKNEAEYQNYLESDDIWIPRVAFIPSETTEPSELNEDTPGRVDFYRMGSKFMEIANNGTLFIFDQPETGETATIDGSVLMINSPYASIDGSVLNYLNP